MSSFDQPQIPPEAPAVKSPLASVESELSRNLDIAAARQYFQPTGMETTTLPNISAGGGAESAIMSKMATLGPGLETAMLPGGETAAMAAAKSAISPMVQLIMRLPGVLGAGTGFFEFLAALFLPGNLIEAFNPLTWANQLAGGVASLKSSLLSSMSTGEHMATSLSMLPAHAPIFHNMGMHMQSLQSGMNMGGLEHSISMSDGLGTQQFNIEDLNISGPLDLKKPQFEMGSTPVNKLALRHDGLLSGPSVNPDFSPAHLSGAGPRLFSDQMSSGSMFSSASTSASGGSFVSASGVPAGSNSALNIGSNSFSGQDMGSLPANYQLGEGAISGPGMSGNVGYQMSGAQPSLDAAPKLSPSGRLSDTLGGKPDLVAQNSGLPDYYRPSMSNGGYNVPTEAAPAGDATAASGGKLEGLRAEPMSILKKPIGTNHGHGARTVDSIGHQSKGSMSSHQGSSSGSGRGAMDQISHRITPKAYGQARGAHVSAPRHDAVHTAVPEQQGYAQPANQQLDAAQYQQAGSDQLQQAQAPGDQAQPATDAKVEALDYKVKHGDCLWDIAKKHYGDGTKWTEIYKVNADVIGANPDLIHTGLELKLPGVDAGQATANAGQYSVQPGDNLWDIAHDQLGDGTKWGEIYKANTQVIGDNPRLILPGQQLQMPGQQQLISQAPAASAAPVGPSADAGSGLQSSATTSTVPFHSDPAPAAMQPVSQAVPVQQVPVQHAQLQHAPVEARPQTISDATPSPMYPSNPGPGAALAATLDAPPSPIVSSSLAPDLSFLGLGQKK